MVALDRLLDEVAAKVRFGDFSGLAGIVPKLEAALAELSGMPPSVTLERLRTKAETNARLLEAARRGVKAARRRIEDARQVTQGLQTYDMSGKRSDIAVGTTTSGRF